MTMHLEGPWLSTTGKKKGKKKFASAEHARKAREQEESWKELLKRHGVEQEARKRNKAMSAPTLTPPKIQPYRRETPHIASLNSNDSCGVATKAPEKVYTGNSIVGIATMHKSNAVPVFSAEDAVDIAKMRR